MEDLDEGCDPGLFLGLGMCGHVVRPDAGRNSVDLNKSPVARTTAGLDLSFALCPDGTLEKSPTNTPEDDRRDDYSSTPSYGSCGPRRNDHADNSGKEGGCRKKLRLSKEQSTLLEESFNLHNTLTPAQKQSLAHQLNLKPRQVEVWFQNRRARSKLKQMEVDCVFLKKCCESLSNENRGLKKELQELRSTRDDWKHGHPCPSCCEKRMKP